MALQRKYVLQGTREDFVEHLTARMQEANQAAAPDAKGTGKEKHGHEMFAAGLEWAIAEFEAWEETDGDGSGGEPTVGTNGSVPAATGSAAVPTA